MFDGLVDLLSPLAASAMPDSCVIQTRITSGDGYGGTTLTYTASAPIPCRVFTHPRPVDERDAEGRLESIVRWMAALPAGTAITAKDRLLCNGVQYEVAGVIAPQSFEVQRLVELEVLS